jgi:hypothetical protein
MAPCPSLAVALRAVLSLLRIGARPRSTVNATDDTGGLTSSRRAESWLSREQGRVVDGVGQNPCPGRWEHVFKPTVDRTGVWPSREHSCALVTVQAQLLFQARGRSRMASPPAATSVSVDVARCEAMRAWSAVDRVWLSLSRVTCISNATIAWLSPSRYASARGPAERGTPLRTWR